MTDETLLKIYNSSVKVFSEKGFQKASMDEIALASGVAKGTLYYHFKSKDDLFGYMVENEVEGLIHLVSSKIVNVSGSDEKLKKIIKYQLEYFRDNKSFCRILLTDVWGDDIRQQRFRKSLVRYLNLIQQVLNRGKQEGKFSFHCVETITAGVFGGISIAYLHRLLKGEDFPVDKIAEDMSKIILDGLKGNL